MKKYVLAMIACSMLFLAACGKEQPTVETNQDPQDVKTEQPVAGDKAPEVQADESKSELKGYAFASNDLKIYMDQDMADVLKGLGEPVTYFEAASCAFEGLDKVYTYEHFVINTYPKGDKDYISSIVLMDDLIETPEGVYIGSSATDVVNAYGSNYVESAGAYTYSKDGMDLMFLLNGDTVKSIQYFSGVLSTGN